MKKCSKCKKEKPFKDFHKRNNRPSGHNSQCKSCRKKNKPDRSSYARNYDLKRSYGITLDDYNQMFSDQKGCCAICNRHIGDLNMKRKKNLCVDHCHKTKKVRGLLCDKCNRALGLFNDDADILHKAIIYLTSSILA